MIMKEKIFIKNTAITFLLILAATVSSLIFQYFTRNNVNVMIIYMMAVFLVARFTDGYGYGIAASFICVIAVNLIFTFPYMKLNFIIKGYPLTFLGMILISAATSAMTTHLKVQSHLITEREIMLLEAEKEKMRANLLRAISHDLRTPLTSIIGTSSTYLEQYGSISEWKKKEMVQTILDDSNWLLNMVENLLSVTRIQGSQMKVNKTSEPLEEVVSEAVQRFHKRLPEAIVGVCVPDEFIMLPMDATLIEQVIINLLENAVYHGRSNEPIKMSVTIDDTSAAFSITDYGMGIDPSIINTIFDGYTTNPNSSSDARKGMGIGLSICKTIINAHGGTIQAANHEDGAKFTFTLPLGEKQNES